MKVEKVSVKEIVETEVEKVVLTLDRDEAQALADVLCHIGGNVVVGDKENVMQSFSNTLSKAGIYYNNERFAEKATFWDWGTR